MKRSIRMFGCTVCVLLLSACASMAPVADADRELVVVHDVPGVTKDRIFESSKIWIAENFRSAKKVIEYENKKDGVLIGNGAIKFPCSGIECIAKNDWQARFTMRMDMKDNKVKLSFTNIGLYWPPSYSVTSGGLSGYDGPVNTQGDMTAIKGALHDTGNSLVRSLKAGKASQNW